MSEEKILEELYTDSERKCEMCSTVVAYRHKRTGRYKLTDDFGHQFGKSNKYKGELASFCKKHSA